MLRLIATLVFVFLFLLLGLPVLGIEWLVSKKNPDLAIRQQDAILKWAARVITRICGVKIVTEGTEKIPADRSVLYVANHSSFFDVFITYQLNPTVTGYVSKNDFLKLPVLPIWMHRLYSVFINRDDLRQSMKTILRAIDYEKQGISMFIFPEGTRSKDGAVHEFHAGSFKIATKSGALIVPIGIVGSRAIWEAQFPIVHPGTVYLRYGDPIDPASLSADEKKHIADLVKEQVEGLIADIKKDHGLPE